MFEEKVQQSAGTFTGPKMNRTALGHSFVNQQPEVHYPYSFIQSGVSSKKAIKLFLHLKVLGRKFTFAIPIQP